MNRNCEIKEEILHEVRDQIDKQCRNINYLISKQVRANIGLPSIYDTFIAIHRQLR